MRRRRRTRRDEDSPSRRVLADFVASRGGLPDRGDKDPRDGRGELDLEEVRRQARRLADGRGR